MFNLDRVGPPASLRLPRIWPRAAGVGDALQRSQSSTRRCGKASVMTSSCSCKRLDFSFAYLALQRPDR